MTRPTTVEEYLAGIPDDRRAVMEELRAVIKAAAPHATETIAYNMPAYRIDRRFLVSIEAYKSHYSLFPASEAVRKELGDQLGPFFSGKGTIRFPAGQPIPTDLVRRVVELRVKEVAAKQGRY